MITIPWDKITENPAPAQREPIALTIGVFDGIHIGHQKLISKIVHNSIHALPAICTFRQNPGTVLGIRPNPGSILSFRQKMLKFEELGVLRLVLIDFSFEISKLTAEDFLGILERAFQIRQVAVGCNFHMGRGRATGVRELDSFLRASRTRLLIVPETQYHERTVSSSRIREAIIHGRFREVRDMLNGEYRLDITEAKIEKTGSKAAISRREIFQILPRQGSYRAMLLGPEGTELTEVRIGEERLEWDTRKDLRQTEICFCE